VSVAKVVRQMRLTRRALTDGAVLKLSPGTVAD
jgi:hypothetical protein